MTVGPLAGLDAVQLLALPHPESLLVLHVTVLPPLLDGVQVPTFTHKVSVVWQLTAGLPVGFAVQDDTFVQPGSAGTWQRGLVESPVPPATVQ